MRWLHTVTGSDSKTAANVKLSGVRSTPFVKRIFLLGLLPIPVLWVLLFLLPALNVSPNYDFGEYFYHPLLPLVVAAILLLPWLLVEKFINYPSDLTYTERATSILLLLLMIASYVAWNTARVHIKDNVIGSDTELILVSSIQIFWWPLMAVGGILALLGVVEMWRLLAPFVVAAPIIVFFATGFFGYHFHAVWIIIALSYAIFGGTTWLVHQWHNRSKSLRRLWGTLLIALLAWLPVSGVIAKIQVEQSPLPSTADLVEDCAAENVTPVYYSKKDNNNQQEYIPGIVVLKAPGRIFSESDQDLLTTVQKAGVIDPQIAQRLESQTSTYNAKLQTTEVYLRVSAEHTVEAACILRNQNKGGSLEKLFGTVELLNTLALCDRDMPYIKKIFTVQEQQKLCTT